MASENLECAFYCDPLTGVETVRNLTSIIARDLPDSKFVHVSIHPNYRKAKETDKKSFGSLLAYFEVELKDFPQDAAQASGVLDEFRTIHNLAIS
jgi:hypothetical protein